MSMKHTLSAAALTALLWSASAPAELTIPEVDLTGLEPAVAEQLQSAFDGLKAESEALDPSEWGPLYGQLGRLFHAYAFAEQAVFCYERAALLVPREFAFPYLAAVLLAGQGEQARAIAGYRATLVLQPEYAPAVVKLAQLFRESGDLEAATLVIARLRGRIEQDPAIAAAFGEHELASGDFEAAADHLTLALEAVPQANRLHYLLGQAYRGLGEKRAARDQLKLSGEVGLTPADPLLDEVKATAGGEIIYLLGGHRAFNAGDYGAAVEAFGKAVQARPDSIRARVNLAAALGQAGQGLEAIEQFKQVLAQQPDNKTALYNLATLSIAAGAYAEADGYYRTLLELDEYDFEAHLQRATLLRAMGDEERALFHLRKAQNDLGTFRRAVLTESEIRVARDELEQALVLLDTATGLLPSDSEILLTYANLLSMAPGALRDPQRALETATLVHAHTPSFQSAESLALAHAALNQCADAVRWLNTGIELAGERRDVAARLSHLKEGVGASSDCRP